MGSTEHWEAVYRGGATEELGWYEPRPSTLDLLLRFSDPADAVIDVGAGDSRLVDELLHAGYQQVAVLDLSETALHRVQARLGSAAGTVTWICADVTRWTPPRSWDVWHDRAVFHFLTREEDRLAYKATALNGVGAGGRMIMATFALGGPDRCAGLPVKRYGAEELAEVFAPEFQLLEQVQLQANPSDTGDKRPYVSVVLERV